MEKGESHSAARVSCPGVQVTAAVSKGDLESPLETVTRGVRSGVQLNATTMFYLPADREVKDSIARGGTVARGDRLWGGGSRD